jgi:2-dehydropantoate 2-reductase
MAIGSNARITIAGAGSVGCYIGGCLVLAGRNVTFLLRQSLAEAFAQHGVRITDLDKTDRIIAPARLKLTTDPASALADADVILVTVKSGATTTMADLIAKHARASAVVVSLQNGVDNVDLLRRRLGPTRWVLAGMVPFNVIQMRPGDAPPRFHRATSGTILVGSGCPGLRDCLNVMGATVAEHNDMAGVLLGKLVINLNNALNALSGLSLVAELSDRRWRLLFARQIDEALNILKAAGKRPFPIEGVHPWLIAWALRLPNWLFKLVARSMLAIDATARSSMWEDLEAHRLTEIDHMQGTVVVLAGALGLSAPLNQRVAELVKEAERAAAGSPRLSPLAVEPARNPDIPAMSVS